MMYQLSKEWKKLKDRTILFITSNEAKARGYKADLEFLTAGEIRGEVCLFPAPDVIPYLHLTPQQDIWIDRLKILDKLSKNKTLAIITPVEALLRKNPPKWIFERYNRRVNIHDALQLEEFSNWLVEAGFINQPLVEDEGTFSIRGGIVDIFPSTSDRPIRCELDGDEIVSMRTFDPATQKSSFSINSFTLIPVRNVILSSKTCDQALKDLKQLCDSHAIGPGLRREFAESISHKFYAPAIDTLMPVFYEETASLIDYLPPDTVIFTDDEIEINESSQKLKTRLEAAYGSAKHIEKIVEPSRLYDNWSPNIGVKLQKITSVQGLSGDIKIAINQIKRWQEMGLRIITTAHTSTQAERMHDIFSWHELVSEITDRPFADVLHLGRSIVWIMPGELSKGFVAEKDGIVVLTDTDIFGSKISRRPVISAPAETFTDFSQIDEGNCIIHKEHGIGRYIGLKNMEIAGVKNDFLLLEYLGGDKLYLPVWKINLISRYLGAAADSGKIALDRLGSKRWARIKAKVTSSIRTMAMELLKIYASRKANEGFAFNSRDEQFEEFEAAFPYDETPDQWKAIEETLNDMREDASMDRLICGDVGYGKTEVAMRAAFRAVADGKQVAILVPTTVLAFQHYENFMSRFSKWPVRIEMLSRFRSRSEQKHIISEVASGMVNIAIGTHRLLQRDIKFKDIGLLIVDEEHRFGVAHKEKIRKISSTVDTITMSATPIPRTLHLSLSGIRNISIINTPPANRLAIRTYVSEFDEDVIRGAIMAELSRGGQVFFVHNRVESIDKMHMLLAKLVPEAKIVVGHGQMGEHELENVMISFLENKANVLLCTTIIESGIDIPTANTIIINRADMLGLAQLYQLRGRVGRSTLQAYAYLLIPSEETVNPTAQKRLALLQRYTELGSGFQIAMHDLEIRGAGNILGAQQSGHINAIGYEMYIDLLERAIRHLQGKPETLEIDSEINLPVEAFIPTDYVEDEGQRLVLYRRLASIGSSEGLDSLALEITDRYGKIPETLKNLLTIVEIKLTAKKLCIESMQYDGRIFSCKFHQKTPVKPEVILSLVKNDPKKFAFKQPNMFFIKEISKNAAAMLSTAKTILYRLNP